MDEYEYLFSAAVDSHSIVYSKQREMIAPLVTGRRNDGGSITSESRMERARNSNRGHRIRRPIRKASASRGWTMWIVVLALMMRTQAHPALAQDGQLVDSVRKELSIRHVDLEAMLAIDPNFGEIELSPKYVFQSSHPEQPSVAKREAEDDDAPPPAAKSTDTSHLTRTASAFTATTVAKATSTSSPTEEIDVASTSEQPLPTPFDSNIGQNFTEPNCPVFIKSMVKDAQFQECMPFSAFLGTSSSFFNTLKSPAAVDKLLNVSCSADTLTCSVYLNKLASILIEDQNCGKDFAEKDPIVTMAYQNLISYVPLYTASCLKIIKPSPTTGKKEYCFTQMVNDTVFWADSYVYYLGVGSEFPGKNATEGGQKTGDELRKEWPFSCNDCLKRVMNVFEDAAERNSTSPVRKVWKGGVETLNEVCGEGWVKDTLEDVVVVALTNNAERTTTAGFLGLVIALIAAFMLL